MKRDQFLKTLAVFSGGLTVVSCTPLLLDEILEPDEVAEDLSIKEAKKWFDEVYLQDLSKLRINIDEKAPKRKAAWERAKKPKNDRGEEFGWVWTPIDYEGTARPGVILYDEETKYRLTLSKYFLQPILSPESW